MFIYCICTQYLVGAPFALITASIRRGMEVISLWHCWGGMEAQILWQWPSAHLHFLVSCFSFSSWQYPIDSLCSGLVSLLASQAHQPCSFNQLLVLWQCGRCQILLENVNSASLQSWSAKGSMKCSKILVNVCNNKRVQWCCFQKKHNGPTPADDIAPQIITDCGNLTLDFKQLGLWASPPFLQTLGPWFSMKYKTCSHLKRWLWTTGQQSSSSL